MYDDQQFLIWLTIAICAILFELQSPVLFFFLSLACGAGVATGISLLTQSTLYPWYGFALCSVISFCILRQLSKKYTKHSVTTNVYALVGKEARVLTPISAIQSGSVKVHGEVWSARTNSEKTFYEHDTVIIQNIQGCHVIVQERH